MPRTRTTTSPDLFSAGPLETSTPKYLPKLPATAQEEASLRAELWETAPRHIKGVVLGENCIWYQSLWRPVSGLTTAELVECFSLS